MQEANRVMDTSAMTGVKPVRHAGTWWRRKHAARIISQVAAYGLLLPGACAVLVPIFWMITTSLKPPTQIFTYPPEWIPKPFRWDNYARGWATYDFTLATRNTVMVTLLGMFGSLASTSLVAYSFARLEAPGRDFLFSLVLATMMLPHQVTMVPRFLLFRYMGWINTLRPLWIPSCFATSAFSIFLLRQFLMTIPRELDDAARIDGCTAFGIYWRIMLPLLKPALAAVAIFHFMWSWNDFMDPLIYISSKKNWVLSLAINAMKGQFYTDLGSLMAVSFLVLLPCIIVFFTAQRYFVEGIVTSGVKG